MVFKKLDIRPMVKEGVEPLSAIRKKVDTLKEGEGLMLIAPFLPSPLIELLQNERFSSRVEHSANGAWITYFWREIDSA